MDTLTTPEVAVLVGMIDTGGRSGRWWAQKARVIVALSTLEDGDWWNGPDVERLTGIPAAHARRLLLDLARQRVILRDGGGLEHEKLFWCEVNPDWRRWEVEWAFPLRDVEMRLEFARASWGRHPVDRLFARPAGARFHLRFAQLLARANAREIGSNGRFARNVARAQPITDSRAWRARKRAELAQGGLSLDVGDARGASSSVAPQEEEGMQHPAWRAVRHAYARAAGINTLYPKAKPTKALAALLAEHGPEPILEAIAQAPEGLGVATLVEWVGDRCEEPELATVTPLVDPAEVALKRRRLEQMIATYRENGDEPPESLVSALAAWQDEDVPQEA
jgi:hypothetical protein